MRASKGFAAATIVVAFTLCCAVVLGADPASSSRRSGNGADSPHIAPMPATAWASLGTVAAIIAVRRFRRRGD